MPPCPSVVSCAALKPGHRPDLGLRIADFGLRIAVVSYSEPQRFTEDSQRSHRGSVPLCACLRAPLWFPARPSNRDIARIWDCGLRISAGAGAGLTGVGQSGRFWGEMRRSCRDGASDPAMCLVRTGHVSRPHRPCLPSAPAMSPVRTGHVSRLHRPCLSSAPAMSLVCTGHVSRLHRPCVPRIPAMCPADTGHVSRGYRPCLPRTWRGWLGHRGGTVHPWRNGGKRQGAAQTDAVTGSV